jgi:hypothetical protein
VELGAEVDGWYDGLARGFGANVEERGTFRVARDLGVIEALGCKSAGGLMGRPIDAGLYGYVGLRIFVPEPAGLAR